MSRNDNQTIFAIIIIGFLLFTRRSTGVSLKQTCVFPDSTTVLVPLGDPCPYDVTHGGQSYVQEFQP